LLAKGYTKETTIATIANLFEPNSETFMATPIASGFVTNLFKTQLLAQFSNLPSKAHKQLTTSIFDCWLTVVYTRIWCMRNDATYLPSKDVRFDGRDMHIHHRNAQVRPLPTIPRYDPPTTDSDDETDPTQPRLTIAEALENQQRLYELATATHISRENQHTVKSNLQTRRRRRLSRPQNEPAQSTSMTTTQPSIDPPNIAPELQERLDQAAANREYRLRISRPNRPPFAPRTSHKRLRTQEPTDTQQFSQISEQRTYPEKRPLSRSDTNDQGTSRTIQQATSSTQITNIPDPPNNTPDPPRKKLRLDEDEEDMG
jgi:hypothetical protein